MKVLIFCATSEDETLYRKYAKRGIEAVFTPETLNITNVAMVKGYEAIVIQTRCVITEKIAEKLKEYSVKYVLTRSAGFDHMNIAAMRGAGLKGANVSLYSPNAIAEHTCLLTLSALRNMKVQMKMIENGDYTLKNIRGHELRKMKVGVVGAGRIGVETIKIMKGFTSDVLVFDMFEREDVKKLASYVTLDELMHTCDVIVFHCPATAENYHMVNRRSIQNMKDGVVLINPARGNLWDYQAVYDDLLSGKIGAAAFDVYEDEKQFLRKVITDDSLDNELFIKLKNLDHVTYTAHSAFYTDVAIENMVEVTMDNLTQYMENDKCANEVVES